MKINIMLFIVNLAIFLSSQVMAVPVAQQSASIMAGRGCKWVEKELQWRDGQTLDLKAAQERIKSVKIPPTWSMTPQSAVDALNNMDPNKIAAITYHCTEPTQPEDLVIFYFTYTMSDSAIRTPDIKITYGPATPASAR